MRRSYLYNVTSYTGKTTSLYWDAPLVISLIVDVASNHTKSNSRQNVYKNEITEGCFLGLYGQLVYNILLYIRYHHGHKHTNIY